MVASLMACDCTRDAPTPAAIVATGSTLDRALGLPDTVRAVLLDRDAELAALGSAIDSARAGTGALLLVEGPAGIGKTALLTAAREHATEHGMRVLHGRGAEFEHEYAFAVVRQCLEPA